VPLSGQVNGTLDRLSGFVAPAELELNLGELNLSPRILSARGLEQLEFLRDQLPSRQSTA
jgi:hypothetical protein